MSTQYEKAGVSLEAGYESVRLIKKHIESIIKFNVFFIAELHFILSFLFFF